MSYLATEQITVFPSTKRADKQVSARLMTEQAIVGIVNRLIDRDGFVVTTDDELQGDSGDKHVFAFNIHGYYFEISSYAELKALYNDDESAMNIYAHIFVDTTGNYTELFGQDDEGKYQGLQFSSNGTVENSNNREEHKLLLLTREAFESRWFVPNESRIKFELDGGVI